MAARTLVYEGPFAPALRRLKRVSVFSCGCTLVGVPLLAAYGNEDMDVVQRAAVGVTACTFAVGTTAALTWLSKPYVWRIYRLQAGKELAGRAQLAKAPLQMESFNLLGQVRTTELPNGLQDIRPAEERIFVNFAVDGGAFYVHEEPDCYADDDLYLEVMGRAGLKPVKTE